MAKKFIRNSFDDINAKLSALQTTLDGVLALLANNPVPTAAAVPKLATSKPRKAVTKPKAAPAKPVPVPQAPTPKAKPKVKRVASPGKAKPAPTLADAVKYVLAEYQKLGTGPVRVGQLYDAVQQAGYKFGSASRENNLNYMSKVLRENNAFKRVSLGLYALA